jgi:methyl-accepting chemotaxis protein
MKIDLSIRQRLLGFSTIGLAFIVVVGGLGYLAVTDLSDVKDAITVNGTALKNQLQADMAHDALRGDVLAAMLANARTDATQEAPVKASLAAHVKDFRESIGALEAARLSPEVTAAVAKVKPTMDAYLASAASMVALSFVDPAAAEAKFSSFSTAFGDLEKEMEGLSDTIEQDSKRTQAAGAATADRSSVLMALATFVAGAALFMLGLLLARSIVRPLGEAVALANKVADGDLTGEIHPTSKDETGQLLYALQRMNGSLLRIVGDVRTGTGAIASSSKQIAAGNADLSHRTEEQASSLEETAASMEELASTVKQNADNARHASGLSAEASKVAMKGGEVVGQVVRTMASISESSKKIAEIIGVIDGIAFQTNILALNAAVEAARAGEQGRGFAVVASEVRSLAQRSAGAAKEIKQLISDSVDKVQDGTALVDEAGKTMHEIVGSVQRVAGIMAEISTASEEQSSGIEQINQAVIQMDHLTQQNAALVEEAAAAAESMQEQARSLESAAAVFKVPPSRAAPAASAAQAPPPERRTGNRPANVARLPAKRAAPAASGTAAAVHPLRARKAASGESDWQAF